MIEKYNGWASWETWLYTLEYGFDRNHDILQDIIAEGKQKEYTKEEVQEQVYNTARNLIQEELELIEEECVSLSSFIRSIISNGLRQVDINEIARHETDDAMENWE